MIDNFSDFCVGCNSCNFCNCCSYSTGLRMSENMIFCSGEGKYEPRGVGYQKNYYAFNKYVGKEKFNELYYKVHNILPNSRVGLKDSNKKEEWKKVTNEQWRKLSQIPEFDKEVVESIVGFNINFDDKVKIVVEGKTTYISRESAKALNLI